MVDDPNAAEMLGRLAPPARLALAYAPPESRQLWLGLLALDARLEDAVGRASEPLVAQLRLAWWRDRFGEPAMAWPRGEPLLGTLASWDSERTALGGLVDGWEEVAVEERHQALEAARVEAVAALARLSGHGDEAEQAAVRAAAREWVRGQGGDASHRLPRPMRPLAVLRALALGEAAGAGPLRRLAAAARVGILGR